ncbi:exported hypothetical protein [Parafrankia sp. Ea1.12]|nr:exported hypothetical protein [Parafrankia sp. Ea1.12]
MRPSSASSRSPRRCVPVAGWCPHTDSRLIWPSWRYCGSSCGPSSAGIWRICWSRTCTGWSDDSPAPGGGPRPGAPISRRSTTDPSVDRSTRQPSLPKQNPCETDTTRIYPPGEKHEGTHEPTPVAPPGDATGRHPRPTAGGPTRAYRPTPSRIGPQPATAAGAQHRSRRP